MLEDFVKLMARHAEQYSDHPVCGVAAAGAETLANGPRLQCCTPCAYSLAGGNTRSLAKPALRCFWTARALAECGGGLL